MTATATRITFEAIGTHWEIDVLEPVEPELASGIERKIKTRIETFDQAYSRFRSDSLVWQVAAAPGTYTFPEDASALFDFYKQLYSVTEGTVTPLIGNLMSDAGYDADYSLKPSEQLDSPAAWDDVLSYSHPVLRTHAPVLLDFGAAGKGYIVDIVGELLRSNGVDSFLIDAGGDMLHVGPASSRIGLENPLDSTEVLGVVDLQNQSICGSAGNRRSWAGIHHIINPLTTEPVRDVLATWATAPSAMVADGIATALFFTPAAKLKAAFDFEYFLVRSDMSCEYSPGLSAEIFSGDLA